MFFRIVPENLYFAFGLILYVATGGAMDSDPIAHSDKTNYRVPRDRVAAVGNFEHDRIHSSH